MAKAKGNKGKAAGRNKDRKNIRTAPVKKKAPKRIDLIAGIFIFVFSFCIYANSIRNNYALDDDVICLKNSYVQNGLKNVKEIFTKGYTFAFNGQNTDSYRPLTVFSTALEIYLYGNKPHRHHFINVFLFSLSCLVLFLLLRKMFRNHHFILPLIITLLYASHPIHTEVVANIKSRDEILCFMFFVFSLYSMMIWVEKKKILPAVISCICFFLSLLSKENAMTFLLVYPMVIYYFTDASIKKIMFFTAPYLLVFLAYILIRNSVIGSVSMTTSIDLVNNSLMAAQNYSDRMATAFSMLGKYFSLLLFPVTLSSDYSYNAIPIISWGNIKAILPFILYAGSFVFALATFRRKNYFSFAILFFLITFSTASNIFVIIGSSMAERFIFTPSLGFSIISGLALIKIFRITSGNNNRSALLPVYLLTGVIVILYSFRTIERNTVWKDNEHLFGTDVRNCPNSFRLHFAVACDDRARGDSAKDPAIKNKLYADAIIEYKKSIEIWPKQQESWYNIGVCYDAFKDTANSFKAYKKCVAIDSTYNTAYNNIGVMYFGKMKYDSSLYYFNKAVRFNPKNADAIANIGAVLHTKGRLDEAIPYYEQALAINPSNANIYTNLIRIYDFKKDKAKADYYRKKLAEIK
jgi:protein O-mannosyl-transferase